uniref:O-antigen ligase domain-containing protein n=1 Tax=Ignavibacterium album TaxID=591197 RepID=A0A7V2ZJ20_9BACT
MNFLELKKSFDKGLFINAFLLALLYFLWIRFSEDYQYLIIPIALLCPYFFVFARKNYLPFLLLMYLVLVGEISPSLRAFVHIVGFVSLSIYLFNNKEKINPVIYSIDKRIKRFLFLFFIILFATSIFSKIPMKGLEILLKEIYFFFILFVFYTSLRLNNNPKDILFILMLSATIMSISSIINLSDFNIIELISSGSSSFRSGGLLSNVNALSGYLVIAFPIFVAYIFNNKNNYSKYIYIFGLVILIMGVLSTISRSAGLSIISGVLFFAYNLNRKLFWRILIIIFLLVLIIVLSPFSEFILTAFRLEQGFSQRDLLWELSANMFKHNWLFGVGPGLWGIEMFNYSPVLQDSFVGYLFYDVNKLTEGFNNSHNYYLVFSTDMGISGLFLSIYLPFVFFSIAIENLRFSRLSGSEVYIINLSLVTVGVSMFIRAFFEGISIITFGWIAIDLPFWSVFAILIYYNRLYKEKLQGEN